LTRRRRRRLAAVLALSSLQISACRAGYFEIGAPSKILSHGRPEEVQVGRKDGVLVRLVRPSISGDTIRGAVPGDSTRRTAVAINDVEWALVRGSRPDYSTGAVVVGLALVVVLLSRYCEVMICR
jgi:hypothetical protein